MMLKPSSHYPEPHLTTLTHHLSKFKRKENIIPLSVIDASKPLLEAERKLWVRNLENYLFVGPPKPKLATRLFQDEPSGEKLKNWLGSYNPLPPMFCSLYEKGTRRVEVCNSIREINGSQHSSLLEHVWEPSDPTKGWYGGRPPTLDDLYGNSKVLSRHIDEAYMARSTKRRKRIQELKAERLMRLPAAANDEGDVFTPYETWQWHYSKINPRKIIDNKGLKKFFRDTGVPDNYDKDYHDYWEAQKLAAKKMESGDLLFLYKNCPALLNPEDYRYNAWLEKYHPLNDRFIFFTPRKRPHGFFERKVNAYLMALERMDAEDSRTITKVRKLYEQLFVASPLDYIPFTKHKIYPSVLVGEPYGDYSLEEKKELSRRENSPWDRFAYSYRDVWCAFDTPNFIHDVSYPYDVLDDEGNSIRLEVTSPNTGKVWPNPGIPSRVHETSRVDDELARKITARIFSEENIRGIIRSEMEDFTVALVSEFEAAMEDCVGKVVKNAVAAVAEAHTPVTPTHSSSYTRDGYRSPEGSRILVCS